jgi:hypothetical protein
VLKQQLTADEVECIMQKVLAKAKASKPAGGWEGREVV